LFFKIWFGDRNFVTGPKRHLAKIKAHGHGALWRLTSWRFSGLNTQLFIWEPETLPVR